ncbi:hypothetical protein RclHR1_01410007 [Rhizophagus clarus]|uniref:Uncharacterized protein n=1 Tax=Rhizophagus clarus TaxID=94130 RepID=A0A2Z6QRG4_9GLOM|nr:hypothetical protein RclHR1_01410007 [Rhizophagus clarus]GES74716.1 hypothetical protein RCL_jg10288.t1 [Rhizophagus clarus]
MQRKYELRGIRMLKEKNKEEATICVEGYFNKNTDFGTLLQETPQEDERPWFTDETRSIDIKKTYNTVYKYYLPSEEDRYSDENDDESKQEDEDSKNVTDLKTMKSKEDVKSTKEKESLEIPKLKKTSAKDKNSVDLKQDPEIYI